MAAKVYTANIGTPLARVSPQRAGVDPAFVQNMVKEYEKKGLRIHSFILVRDEQVYAEGYYAPYAPGSFQTVYSLSKSFTSTAMGIAQDEGILSLDEKVIDIFADELLQAGVEPGKELQALTLRHLLRMSTGQLKENWQGDHILAFLREPFNEMPGEVFRYNSLATYMCSAALWKKGIDMEVYLQEKLFDPMGISGLHWMRCERGIPTGGFGLSIVPEVIAKFGILVLNDGVYQGKQLVSKEYLRLATSKQIENAHHSKDPDWSAGYGYQFWMCENGSFRGDGMYGQLCVMNREKNAVLAMTAFVDNIQAEISVYFDEILSKMQDAPLAEDPASVQEMQALLDGLCCPIEPIQDDGTDVPGAFLGKVYPAANGATLTARQVDGGLAVTSPAWQGEALFTRGEMRRQDVELKPMMGILDVKTPGFFGYGLQDGKLVLRVLIIEAMMDIRVEISAGGIQFFTVYDQNNPREMK